MDRQPIRLPPGQLAGASFRRPALLLRQGVGADAGADNGRTGPGNSGSGVLPPRRPADIKRAIWSVTVLLIAPGCLFYLGTVGTWSSASPPLSPAVGSAAVGLPDGKVLVLGAFQQQTGEPLAQTLLFDPQTDRWANRAPIPEPRSDDAIVALPSGDVLVIGGQGSYVPGSNPATLATTWLYHPATDSWSRTGSLGTARSRAQAAVLSDGRVLLVGGSVLRPQPVQLPNGGSDPYQSIGSAEIFDPRSGEWSPAGSLNVVRDSFPLLAIAHGQALVAGGCAPLEVGGAALSSAEVFDPVQDSWALNVPMPGARCAASAVQLADGRALVIGGGVGEMQANFAPVFSTLTFDFAAHTWARAGDVGVQNGDVLGVEGSGGVALLADHRVLILGTQSQGQTSILGGQVFDPSSGAWTFITSTSMTASGAYGQLAPAAIALPNGEAVVLTGLQTFVFHPDSSPPATQLLSTTGTTLVLSAVAAGLALIMLGEFLRSRGLIRRRRRAKAKLPGGSLKA